jgi:hypothetical protein
MSDITRKEKVIEIFKTINLDKDVSIHPNIPQEKINEVMGILAIRKMEGRLPPSIVADNILFIYDHTYFGRKKDFLAFTENYFFLQLYEYIRFLFNLL